MSAENQASAADTGAVSSGAKVSWGDVFVRQYARGIGSGACPEGDPQASEWPLGISDVVVATDSEGAVVECARVFAPLEAGAGASPPHVFSGDGRVPLLRPASPSGPGDAVGVGAGPSSSEPVATSLAEGAPPPRVVRARQLLPCEVRAGSVDDYDEQIASFRAGRDATALKAAQQVLATGAAARGRKRRSRAAVTAAAAAAAAAATVDLSWQGMTPAERRRRFLSASALLAAPAAELGRDAAATAAELAELQAHRRKNNVGCRCALLVQEELVGLDVRDLRNECTLRGLQPRGSKREVMARLVQHSRANLGCMQSAFEQMKAQQIKGALQDQQQQHQQQHQELQKNDVYKGGPDEHYETEASAASVQALGGPSSASVPAAASGTSVSSRKRKRPSSEGEGRSGESDSDGGGDGGASSGGSSSDAADLDADSLVLTLGDVPYDPTLHTQRALEAAASLSEALASEATESAEAPPSSSSSSSFTLSLCSDHSSAPRASASGAAVAGSKAPSLDGKCPCATAGVGCHFSTCACDSDFCANRHAGDPTSASYDSSGIREHSVMVRVMVRETGNLFATPADRVEWRATLVARRPSAGSGEATAAPVSHSEGASFESEVAARLLAAAAGAPAEDDGVGSDDGEAEDSLNKGSSPAIKRRRRL